LINTTRVKLSMNQRQWIDLLHCLIERRGVVPLNFVQFSVAQRLEFNSSELLHLIWTDT